MRFIITAAVTLRAPPPAAREDKEQQGTITHTGIVGARGEHRLERIFRDCGLAAVQGAPCGICLSDPAHELLDDRVAHRIRHVP
jgi:hypothetical protein